MVLALLAAVLALTTPAASQDAASYTITRTNAAGAANRDLPRQQCTQKKGSSACHAGSADFYSAADFSFDEDTKVFKLTAGTWGTYSMSLGFVADSYRGSFKVLAGGPFQEEKLEYTYGKGICHNTVQCCSNSTTPDFGEACCNLPQTGTLGEARACYTFPGTSKWGNSIFTMDGSSYGKYSISSDNGNSYISGTQGKFTDEIVTVAVNYQVAGVSIV